MSIPVGLDELAAAIGRYGPAAFLHTTGADGRPHIVHVAVAALTGDAGEPIVLRLVGTGRSSVLNAVERPAFTLAWPPCEPGGFSLIVDAGAARPGGHEMLVTPTSGVLHRPAPVDQLEAGGAAGDAGDGRGTNTCSR